MKQNNEEAPMIVDCQVTFHSQNVTNSDHREAIDTPPQELWEDDTWITEFQVKLRKLQRKQRLYSFATDAVVAGITIIISLTLFFFIYQEI